VTTVFLLERSGNDSLYTEQIDGGTLSVPLVGSGCAMVQLRQGELVSVFYKGLNEVTRQATALDLRYGERRVQAPAGDHLWASGVSDG
jgi:hypothetical protein